MDQDVEMISQPDLTPAAAHEIIEILNHPEKYEQPDHVLVIGNPGSGKSTVCNKIIHSIEGSHLPCNAQDLINYCTKLTDEQQIMQMIWQYVVHPTIASAQEHKKNRAILLLDNFHLLYIHRHTPQVKCILKTLDPTQYKDIKPSFFIISESLPLDNDIKGSNVIEIKPHDLATRKNLIRYLLKQRHLYEYDTETIECLAQETENKSITTIKAILQSDPASMAALRDAKALYILKGESANLPRDQHSRRHRIKSPAIMTDDLLHSNRTEDNSCCCVIS